MKINLALAELPDFTADPGTDLHEHHTGSVEMAPTMEYIERAFIDAREGRPAQRPFSDGVIPTAFDKTLVPEGYHIMSLFTQWVPADWNLEPHRAELEAYADRMIDCYNELAPNLKSAILHRDIVGPYDMEHDYGLIGGNIFHGELSLEQLFHMRPAPGFADYRTPIAGLYYASSATHAGGGVCGIPGMQAAKAAIADKKASRSQAPAAFMTAQELRATTPARRPGSADTGPPGAGQGRPCARCSKPAAWPWSVPARGRARSASGWWPRWRAARPRQRCTWSTRSTGRSAACRAIRRWPPCPAPWTWCCSGCPTRRWPLRWNWPRAGETGPR